MVGTSDDQKTEESLVPSPGAEDGYISLPEHTTPAARSFLQLQPQSSLLLSLPPVLRLRGGLSAPACPTPGSDTLSC